MAVGFSNVKVTHFGRVASVAMWGHPTPPIGVDSKREREKGLQAASLDTSFKES